MGVYQDNAIRSDKRAQICTAPAIAGKLQLQLDVRFSTMGAARAHLLLLSMVNKPSQQGGEGDVRLVRPAVHASDTAVSITKLSLLDTIAPPIYTRYKRRPVTQLSDGGAVMALCIHHQLYDGRSSFTIAATWGALHRHKDVVPKPLHDSALTDGIAGTTPAPATCDGYRLRGAELDAALTDSTQWISTMDALSAYMWSAVMRASHSAGVLPPDCYAPGAVSRYRFTVDVRRRVDPPLPLHFAGNAVLIAAAEAPMAQVLDPSPSALAATAAAVRAAIEAVDAQQCGTQLAWLAAQTDKSRIIQTGMLPTLDSWSVTSWHMDHAYSVDFGQGCPERLRRPLSPGLQLTFVLPPAPSMSGGVELLVGLSKAVWDALDADACFSTSAAACDGRECQGDQSRLPN
ncbi:hypothetical protein JKP88DRAFT_267088 [Tribonema minus]|uniref:Uncharacterized protein n=1 Tax=Tribonema minus TaxID=303371 RepID=A0A835ZGA9_9STRA|nr:hypothetical protein JKP88DRAFT_267088 [Tribonema minus]